MEKNANKPCSECDQAVYFHLRASPQYVLRASSMALFTDSVEDTWEDRGGSVLP